MTGSIRCVDQSRVNRGQEFVIGGYTIGGTTFDALVFGYYQDGKLMYAARTRNGFTPKIREELMKRFRRLETDKCPFENLPEKTAGRWGAGLTAAKMQECRWLYAECGIGATMSNARLCRMRFRGSDSGSLCAPLRE